MVSFQKSFFTDQDELNKSVLEGCTLQVAFVSPEVPSEGGASAVVKEDRRCAGDGSWLRRIQGLLPMGWALGSPLPCCRQGSALGDSGGCSSGEELDRQGRRR